MEEVGGKPTSRREHEEHADGHHPMPYFMLGINVAQPSTTAHQPKDEEHGDEDTEQRQNRVE